MNELIMKHPLPIIGYACGSGAGNSGCKDGPKAIQTSKLLDSCHFNHHWHAILTPTQTQNKLDAIVQISEDLARATQTFTHEKQLFAVIGGDHSSGIGTWSGCAKGLDGPLGLIWSDAHLDAHTFETTPSQNIHGMPVAALLGHGDPSLVNIAQQKPSIRPEHLCFIGARDYEEGEWQLLQDLGARIIDQEEVLSRGLEDCFDEALSIATNGTSGFGLSIDLDGFDPECAPAVGTPVAQGLDSSQMIQYLSKKHLDQLVGIEIVEYNPSLDHDHKTAKLIPELLNVLVPKANHG